MEFKTQQIEDVTLIHVKGRIDHRTAKDFENALKPHLDECIAGDFKKILMDMGEVDFMTSAGLRVLMIAAKTCKTCDKEKGEIAVAALQPLIKEIFKISRFDLILKVFTTVQSGLENMSSTSAGAKK
ncbi:MAG: STAS domain-containing protein [Deltaproteobacteria bacterium]|nr:STAS domain-containing protein [Deltaproteobacteria bacterium]